MEKQAANAGSEEGRDVAAVPISDGEGCEPDSQLDVWRREQLPALRDGRGVE